MVRPCSWFTNYVVSYALYSFCCQLMNLRFDMYQVQEQPAVTITFLAWSSVEVHSLTQTICSYLLCFSFCMLFLRIYPMLLVTSGPNFIPQHPVLTFQESHMASINADLTEDWLIGDTLSTVRSWTSGFVPSVADLAPVRGLTDYSLTLYLFLGESEIYVSLYVSLDKVKRKIHTIRFVCQLCFDIVIMALRFVRTKILRGWGSIQCQFRRMHSPFSFMPGF